MTYTQNLWLYFTLLFGIILVPGMDMFFVLANTLTNGRRAGLAATAGIMLGGAVHCAYVALGIGLVAEWLPFVLRPILFAGAAYMAWIGVTLIRSTITVDTIGSVDTRSASRAFRQGFTTCMLNPKAYLFTLSVTPQFLKPEYGPILQQGLVIGLMTILTQLLIYGGLAIAAGGGRDFLLGNPRTTIFIGRAAGAIFVLAACLTVWEGLFATL